MSEEAVRVSDDFDRALEMNWLFEHGEELAEKYPGQWLAIDGVRLVGHGHDVKDILRQAAANNAPNPFLTAAPSADEPRVFVGGTSP